MGADDQRGEVERDEAQQEKGERVVGSEEEGVGRCGAGVDVAGVLARKIARGFFGPGGHSSCGERPRGGEAARPAGAVRVQDRAVDVVREDFAGDVEPAELLDDGKGQREGGGGLEGGVA